MGKDIFVFGDSIAAGFYDTETGGWVSMLFSYLNTRSTDPNLDEFYNVFNMSISGDGVSGTLKRLESEILPRQHERETVIILDVGGNDAVRNLQTNEMICPLDAFSETYRALITEAKKFGSVICLGFLDSDERKLNPIPWQEGHAALDEDADVYCAKIEELAAENEVLFFDLSGLFKEDLDRYLEDGDHPNVEGHRRIFEKVKRELEKAGIF